MKKVLVGGRFNVLHPGHVYFLKKAKSLGDVLVVVIASDRTIRKAKRDVLFPENERRRMVSSLKWVDKAVVGFDIDDESGYVKILKKERPDIIALGYDQRVDAAQLRSLAEKAGLSVRIVRIGNYKGYKTKKIMKRK